ncbi:MAG: hypothetical protein HY823_05325 [Acidobacteria bacterium]|nr:hypothetical protein [Acidobacteriota bacterium]
MDFFGCRRRGLGCLLGLLGLLGRAQGPGALPQRHFGFADGLTNLSVYSLVQDESHLIWAGTESGVFRFDGRRFEAMDLPLGSRFVQVLLPTPNGRLWIGTRDGLGSYDPATGQYLQVAGFPSASVPRLGLDRQGALWALTPSGPLRSEDHRTFQVPGTWPGGEGATALFAHPDTEVWAAGNRHLARWDAVERRWVREALPDLGREALPLALAVDGEGVLWLRSNRGLFRRFPGSASWKAVPNPVLGGVPDSPSLTRDREGWVWVNTPRGMLRGRGDSLIPAGEGWTGTSPLTALVDHEGNWWLASVGVSQVLGQGRWSHHRTAQGLPNDVVWSIIRDRQGQVWVATDDGLAVGTPTGWARLGRGQFSRLRLGPDGFIYGVGSPGGVLYRVDPVRRTVESVRVEVLPLSANSRGLAVEPDGTVWVSDFSDGLARGRRRSTGWIWERALVQGSAPRQVWQVMQDDGGSIFLATRRALFLLQDGHWEKIPSTLPHTPFSALRTPDGGVWCSYFDQAILTRHEPRKNGWVQVDEWRPFPDRASLVIYSQARTPEGHLWLGTGQGLARVDPATHRVLDWIPPGEGVPGADATNQGLHLDPDGTLWLGTTEGLGIHHPAPVEAAVPPPAPRLLDWRSGGRALAVGGPGPSLPPGATLEARFALPAYSHPSRSFLEAHLEGVDEAWVPLSEFKVRYAGLPSGQHRLEVRCNGGFGTLGPSLSLPFTVQRPWWKAWWFLALVLAAAGAGVVELARHRERILRARNRQLEELVEARTQDLRSLNDLLRTEKERADEASAAKTAFLATMSHELRTPLNAMLLFSELVQEAAIERGDAKEAADMDHILASGRHLLELINGILDLSKIEAGKVDLQVGRVDPADIAEEIIHTLRPLAEKRGNHLHLDLGAGLPVLRTDPLKLRQILLNLGSNACKFTTEGVITLSVSEEGGDCLFRLEDTGIGMAPDEVERVFNPFEQANAEIARKFGGTGLGLALSSRMAQLLGGSLHLRSEPGRGSCFTLRVPAKPSRA